MLINTLANGDERTKLLKVILKKDVKVVLRLGIYLGYQNQVVIVLAICSKCLLSHLKVNVSCLGQRA